VQRKNRSRQQRKGGGIDEKYYLNFLPPPTPLNITTFLHGSIHATVSDHSGKWSKVKSLKSIFFFLFLERGPISGPTSLGPKIAEKNV